MMEAKVAALIEAINGLRSELPVISIDFTHSISMGDKTSVMVLEEKDLEPIPGQVEKVDQGPKFQYRYRTSKMFGGVEFFCLTEGV
jgi:hypothetical protein